MQKTQYTESEIAGHKMHEELVNYQFALDASCIVSITDKEGIIRHVNNNFCKISKYEAAELIGKDHRIVNSGYHTKSFIHHLWKTITEGKIWRGEIKNKTKDGSYYWLETVIVPFYNADGIPYRYISIHTNITERKKTDDTLAASEIRFRALIENSTEGIALTDEHSNIIYRSPGSVKITGIRPTQNTIGHSHPEDFETIRAKFAETLLHPGKPISFQGRFEHADGHYIWMEGTLTNMLLVNGINAIVSNHRDISKRKMAEERLIQSEILYRNLFENLLTGFVYCKGIFESGQMVDFIFLNVNEEYELQTGFKNVTGKHLSTVLPNLFSSDPEYARVLTRVALKGKSERFERFVERLNKWFTVSLYSPSNGYFVALIDNITEQKAAEQKVNRINDELEERINRRTEELRKKNEEMEAFSYSVSHDLRAPLRGIIGFTTILEEEYSSKLDDEARRLTGIIKNNTQKMGTLIDGLLTFSRIGRGEINKTIIDTHQMVEQVILELKHRNERNTISWTIHPMPYIYGDTNTLHQVWANLLSNAVKYSAVRPNPKIEISSFEKDGQQVFVVRDNGVGFNESYGNKLFKVFQHLHSMNEYEGTGVGLAIVERIISRHGGKVWAEGRIDSGASFYFSLPAINPDFVS